MMGTRNKHTFQKGHKGFKSQLGKKFSDEMKKKLSLAHIGIQAGDKHPNWKGGISRPYGMRLKEKILCETCGKTNCKLNIHHIDCNPKNNIVENLKVLCCSCHRLEHSRIRRLKLSN